MESKCQCVDSPEYEAWRLRIHNYGHGERMLNALGFGVDPMPVQHPVLCDHCQNLKMVGEVCRSLGFPMDNDGRLPYLQFKEWASPTPDDFVLLHTVNQEQIINNALRNSQRDPLDHEPGSVHRERMVMWSGIEDVETMMHYAEIGYWIDLDRRLRSMDEDELREFEEMREAAEQLAEELMDCDDFKEMLGKIEDRSKFDKEFGFDD